MTPALRAVPVRRETPARRGTRALRGLPGRPGDPGGVRPGAGFHRLTPARLLDTRTAGGPVTAQADRLVDVLGRAGVPASGVSAVVVNTTVTEVAGNLDLEVYPAGRKPERRTSNLNAVRGQTVANLVTVALGDAGRIGLSTSAGSTQVVLDVLGWYGDGSSGDGFVPQAPVRRYDSRAATPVSAGTDRIVSLFPDGLPAGTSAVAVSLTALGTPGNADVQLYAPGDRPSRRTSTLNLRKGQTVANLAVVPVDSDGRVAVSVSQGTVQVVLDVVGTFTSASAQLYEPLTPARAYDSRLTGGPVRAGADREVQVTGVGGVPSTGVSAVVVNVTSTGSSDTADLQVYPVGERPSRRTSNLNVRRGQTVPVLVMAKVGRDGRIAVSTSQGSTGVVVDVVGWVRSGS